MPQSHPTGSSAGLDLPSFSDRLPDLVQILRVTAENLESCKPNQSFIPYWEDVHSVAHSLKGVLEILACPPVLAAFIRGFNDALAEGLSGPSICRRLPEVAPLLNNLSRALDEEEKQNPDEAYFRDWLQKFRALYQADLPHEERMKEVPAHLFYVNDQVSKKAREISLLKLNHAVAEDLILLDEIPLWRTQLNEALLSPEFGRGLVVNFLPFISSEGSRKLKVWAWVAAATHSRAALKQRIKEVMPKVQLGKL